MSLIKINRGTPRSVANPFSLFDEAFGGLLGDRASKWPEPSRAWAPPVDISEDEHGLVFTAELPGFDKENVRISVEDGRLTITGERRQERKDEEYHRLERVYGKFERSFSLPTNVDPEKISASLKDGVLTLSVPKREEAKPRQIEVNVQG